MLPYRYNVNRRPVISSAGIKLRFGHVLGSTQGDLYSSLSKRMTLLRRACCHLLIRFPYSLNKHGKRHWTCCSWCWHSLWFTYQLLPLLTQACTNSLGMQQKMVPVVAVLPPPTRTEDPDEALSSGHCRHLVSKSEDGNSLSPPPFFPLCASNKWSPVNIPRENWHKSLASQASLTVSLPWPSEWLALGTQVNWT